MHVKWTRIAALFFLSAVRNGKQETVGNRRERKNTDAEGTGRRAEGWVNPSVMLGCPSNFPANTRRSLSDQLPNSFSATCAEAPHESQLSPHPVNTWRGCVSEPCSGAAVESTIRQSGCRFGAGAPHNNCYRGTAILPRLTTDEANSFMQEIKLYINVFFIPLTN